MKSFCGQAVGGVCLAVAVLGGSVVVLKAEGELAGIVAYGRDYPPHLVHVLRSIGAELEVGRIGKLVDSTEILDVASHEGSLPLLPVTH